MRLPPLLRTCATKLLIIELQLRLTRQSTPLALNASLTLYGSILGSFVISYFADSLAAMHFERRFYQIFTFTCKPFLPNPSASI
jgi:hypothetical protein